MAEAEPSELNKAIQEEAKCNGGLLSPVNLDSSSRSQGPVTLKLWLGFIILTWIILMGNFVPKE